jgi:hypothetical protein
MSKTWTKAEILRLLETDDRAVERAILLVYKNQTNTEKESSETTHTNHMGFSKAHAKKFSGMAQQLINYPGYRLSPRQLSFARQFVNGNTRIGRYHEQLLKEANRQKASEQKAA